MIPANTGSSIDTAMNENDQQMFTTRDRDNDQALYANCGQIFTGKRFLNFLAYTMVKYLDYV